MREIQPKADLPSLNTKVKVVNECSNIFTSNISLGANNIISTGLIQGFNIPALDVRITAAQTTANNALLKTGGTMIGNIVMGVNNIIGTGLIQGFNIPALDVRITAAQTTANNALLRTGGAMTGHISTNQTSFLDNQLVSKMYVDSAIAANASVIKPSSIILYNEIGEKKVSLDVIGDTFKINTELPVSIQNVADVANSIGALESNMSQIQQELQGIAAAILAINNNMYLNSKKIDDAYNIIACLTNRPLRE